MKDEAMLLIAGLGLLLLMKPKTEETTLTTEITTPTKITPTEEPIYNTIEEIPLPQGVKMEDIIWETTYDRETGFYTMPTVEQVETYLANLNQTIDIQEPITEQLIIEPIMEQPIIEEPIEDIPKYANGRVINFNLNGIVKEAFILNYEGNKMYNVRSFGVNYLISESDIVKAF